MPRQTYLQRWMDGSHMDGQLQQIGENAKKYSVILNLSLWSVRWRAMMCFRLIWLGTTPYNISHIYWALSLTYTGLFYIDPFLSTLILNSLSHMYWSLLFISFSIHTYTGLSLTHIPLRCALPCLNNRDTLHLPSGAVYAHIQPTHTEELYNAQIFQIFQCTMHGENETPQEPPDWCFV